MATGKIKNVLFAIFGAISLISTVHASQPCKCYYLRYDNIEQTAYYIDQDHDGKPKMVTFSSMGKCLEQVNRCEFDENVESVRYNREDADASHDR